jgi:hypothetical protein
VKALFSVCLRARASRRIAYARRRRFLREGRLHAVKGPRRDQARAWRAIRRAGDCVRRVSFLGLNARSHSLESPRKRTSSRSAYASTLPSLCFAPFAVQDLASPAARSLRSTRRARLLPSRAPRTSGCGLRVHRELRARVGARHENAASMLAARGRWARGIADSETDVRAYSRGRRSRREHAPRRKGASLRAGPRCRR